MDVAVSSTWPPAHLPSLIEVVHWAVESGLQNHWGIEVWRHQLQTIPLAFREDGHVQFLSSIRVVRKIMRSPFDVMLARWFVLC